MSAVVRDAWIRTLRTPVHTSLGVLIVLLGTVAIFATTGLALAGQQRAVEVMNSPDGRMITIFDSSGSAELSAESVAVIESLPAVEWVLGVGPARDMRNPVVPDTPVVPVRTVHGTTGMAVLCAEFLAPGQSLRGVDVEWLAFGNGTGTLRRWLDETIVVGDFVAPAPLKSLNASVLRRQADGETAAQVRAIYVTVGSVTELESSLAAIRQIVIARQPAALEFQVRPELAALSEEVAEQLAANARSMVATLVSLVFLLVAAVQFARVSAMARDIGRRRALGASRSLIVFHVVVMCAITSLVGALMGVTAGAGLVWSMSQVMPTAAFCAGVVILMVLAGVLGSVPPALRAAFVDPVRVLRVP